MNIEKEIIKDTLEGEGFVLNSYNSAVAVFQKENLQIDITDLNKVVPKITDRQFILNAEEEEILSVLESFLNRLKYKDWAVLDKFGGERYAEEEDKLIITDKTKARIVREIIKAFEGYKN